MGRVAPKGNNYAVKLKEKDERVEAYKQYCEHIATGKSKESWVYKHPTDPLLSLTSKTMEKYIEENPRDFPPILREQAMAQALAYFEEEGVKLMRGQYRHGSPVVWQTFMRNKFRYDRFQDTISVKCSSDEILAEIRKDSPDKNAHYGLECNPK